MDSAIRRNWQHFKLRHPEFEKSKPFKSDVGPQLDKLSDALAEHWRMVCALKRQGKEVARIAKIVQAALKGYEAVCLTLGPRISADFAAGQFLRYVNGAVEEYSRQSTLPPKPPDSMLLENSVVEKVTSEEESKSIDFMRDASSRSSSSASSGSFKGQTD